MKKISLWVLVAVLMVAIPFAYATVIKDDMTYEGTMTQTGNATRTGTLTQTGDVTLTGDLRISSGAFTLEVPTITYTSGSGFVVTGADDGNIILANSGSATDTGSIAGADPDNGVGPADGAGVTVVLPVPTATLHGTPFTIIKSDSGATDIFVYVNGTCTIGTSSATTDNATLDTIGDNITLIANYNSAVSYVRQSSYVQ